MQTSDPQLFWIIVAAIGQAFGAIATAGAVAVSLWIALSDRRVRLDVKCGLRITFAGDGSPARDIVAVSITNTGYRAVRVVNIGWETGWFDHKAAPEYLAKQYAVQQFGAGSPVTPLELSPGGQATCFISVSEFLRPNTQEKNQSFFARKLPWRERIIPAKVTCVVWTSVGRPTKVRAEKPLARFFTEGVIDGGASRFNG